MRWGLVQGCTLPSFMFSKDRLLHRPWNSKRGKAVKKKKKDSKKIEFLDLPQLRLPVNFDVHLDSISVHFHLINKLFLPNLLFVPARTSGSVINFFLHTSNSSVSALLSNPFHYRSPLFYRSF